MRITDYLEILKSRYGITDEDIKRKAFLNGANNRTVLKEIIGDKAIDRFHIFHKIFGSGISIEEITDKNTQMRGVDYRIRQGNTVINIDLKSLVGDYFDDNGLRIPLECITRNDGIVHSTYCMKDGSDKLTDYYLFLCHQCTNNIIYYVLLSKEYCIQVAKNTPADKLITAANGHGTYTIHYPQKYDKIIVRGQSEY